jgi:hypothetical protein
VHESLTPPAQPQRVWPSLGRGPQEASRSIVRLSVLPSAVELGVVTNLLRLHGAPKSNTGHDWGHVIKDVVRAERSSRSDGTCYFSIACTWPPAVDGGWVNAHTCLSSTLYDLARPAVPRRCATNFVSACWRSAAARLCWLWPTPWR